MTHSPPIGNVNSFVIVITMVGMTSVVNGLEALLLFTKIFLFFSETSLWLSGRVLIHGCKSWLKIPCRFRGPHYTGQCTGYYVIHLPALIPGSLPFASQVTMSLRGETRRQNKESLGSRLFSHLLIAPPPPQSPFCLPLVSLRN